MNKLLLPNTICIGGQRCGSTALMRWLRQHPDCYWLEGEPNSLITGISENGPKAIVSNYAGAHGGKHTIIGEKSPAYASLYLEEVANIHRIIPDLRIIYVVRNPIDRCWSSLTRGWSYEYLEGQRKGPQSKLAILRSIDGGIARRHTDYIHTLRLYRKFFPDKNLLVLTFDELTANPEGFAEKITSFLGIKPLGTIVDFGKKINRTKVNRPIPPFARYLLARRWYKMVVNLVELNIGLPATASWKYSIEQILADGDINGWKVRAAAILALSDMEYRLVYFPVSRCRSFLRARSTSKLIDRFNVDELLSESVDYA